MLLVRRSYGGKTFEVNDSRSPCPVEGGSSRCPGPGKRGESREVGERVRGPGGITRRALGQGAWPP